MSNYPAFGQEIQTTSEKVKWWLCKEEMSEIVKRELKEVKTKQEFKLQDKVWLRVDLLPKVVYTIYGVVWDESSNEFQYKVKHSDGLNQSAYCWFSEGSLEKCDIKAYLVPGSIWQRYTGGQYEVICTAADGLTGKPCVIYKNKYAEDARILSQEYWFETPADSLKAGISRFSYVGMKK